MWNRHYQHGPLQGQLKLAEEWVTASNTPPALGDPVRFAEVQRQFKERAPSAKPPAELDSSRPLSGLIRCGLCGCKYVATYGYEKLGKRYDYCLCSQVVHQVPTSAQTVVFLPHW